MMNNEQLRPADAGRLDRGVGRPVPERADPRDVLDDLKAAAARKWRGDPACQQAGLFARAADEIARLRVKLHHAECHAQAEQEDGVRWRFVRDSDSPLWRPFALRQGGPAEAADACVDLARSRTPNA